MAHPVPLLACDPARGTPAPADQVWRDPLGLMLAFLSEAEKAELSARAAQR